MLAGDMQELRHDPVDGASPVYGWYAPGLESVGEALANQLAAPDQLGAAVSAVVDGEPVVDLWGGWADLRRTKPWDRDTLVNAYSVGKPLVAMLVLELVEQGRVDLDDAVAEHWPDFAQKGKQAVTIRHALSHQAGVPAMREPLVNADLEDFDRMCAALAATTPWWEPGSRVSYHTNTYGHLVGGIVRAVTGDLPGTRLRSLCAPLDADLHFGLPDQEHDRVAEISFVGGDPPDPFDPGLDTDTRMTLLSYANPPGYSSIGMVNTAAWRRAQVPSTNGHMNARGVARLYQGLLDSAVLHPDLLAEATRPQASGYCPTLGQEVTFGLGFQPWTANRPLGRTPGGYGHFGSGGSLGFADPARGVAVGYVTNHVVPRWQNTHNRAIIDALYAAL